MIIWMGEKTQVYDNYQKQHNNHQDQHLAPLNKFVACLPAIHSSTDAFVSHSDHNVRKMKEPHKITGGAPRSPQTSTTTFIQLGREED